MWPTCCWATLTQAAGCRRPSRAAWRTIRFRPLQPGLQYPGEGGHVAYEEGLFIGYRHVDRHGLTPLFPFGFGLSYTTFALSDARLSTD